MTPSTATRSKKNILLDMEEDFPPLGSGDTDSLGKKARKNGTTPKKSNLGSSVEYSTVQGPSSNSTATAAKPTASNSNISTAARSLSRKLDSALKKADDEVTYIDPTTATKATLATGCTDKQWTPKSTESGKKELTFQIGTSFNNATVDSQLKRPSKSSPEVQSTAPSTAPARKPWGSDSTATYSAATKAAPVTKPAPRITAVKQAAPPKYQDPPPQGQLPEPAFHTYTFVARTQISVPTCTSFQYKVMNLLAYAMNILRQYDPSATYLHITDNTKQAATIQELPKLQDFLNDWSYFEHTKEDFRHFNLEPGKFKRYFGSVLIGCTMDPKTLLSESFLDLDRDIDLNIGGGKITLEYKQMQAVDTDRNWILFGVPSDTHPESFGNMLKPFLQNAMWKMRDKNPSKYKAAKYSSPLPQFVVNIMYVQNVPFRMTEKLPAWAKKCIHIEIRQSDRDLFKEIFRFVTISHLDKRLLGNFARFYYGPTPGSQMTEKEDLGKMLQNHVAVVRSMGKVALPGITYPDKIMQCQMANDEEGDPRDPVHISLRRILMKQRIGYPKVWQCILPNAGGGWDGYYANGLGCEQHRKQALTWAICVPAHLRFHLLRKGVLVESMADFINQVFAPDAASEAFSAKLIKGEVYTYGAASAESMRNDIISCRWIDVTLGQAGESTETNAPLSRPAITLKHNGDLSAHNFTVDHFPAVEDTNSVAYSTSGETTLGDGDYEGPETEVQVVEMTERGNEDDDKSFLSMDGSTESEIWNSKKKKADTTYIENIRIMDEIPPPAAVAANIRNDELAALLIEIDRLRTTNRALMDAAASSQPASNLESHSTTQPPEKPGDTGEGSGGMH